MLPPQAKKGNIFINLKDHPFPGIAFKDLAFVTSIPSHLKIYEGNRSGFLSQLSCVLGTTVKSVGYSWHIPGKKQGS
jgi:hypothetical protein